jgi:hypothetical protein
MVDPVTIGALAASALAITADAMLKSVVGEAVKDAYKTLKDKVVQWAGGDVEALEKAPDSPARKAVVAEAIDAQPAEETDVVRALAERLISALKTNRNVGLDIGQLDSLEVQLGTIKVTDGTGVRIGKAKVQGALRTGEIDVGPPGKV